MYQNTESADALRVRSSSKFGKFVRFVAGAVGLSSLVFGALPVADAQTYSLQSFNNLSLSPGSTTTFRLEGTQTPVSGQPGHHTAYAVSGAWSINGQSNSPVNFAVQLMNGYQPGAGAAFRVFTYGSIGGTSTGAGFTPPLNAPRYVNYLLPSLSQSHYQWRPDWSTQGEFWFRVEELQDQFGLTITGTGTDHGDITVTGSNGAYLSSIATVTPAPGANSGFIDIEGPFPEDAGPGELYVLVDLEGSVDVATFMQTLQRLPDSPTFQYEIAGETNFENMRLKYGNDWEVLVKFQGLPSGATQNNMKVNWNFARTSDMNVERMLVVPEPTTLFVCVAGLLTMAAYRPRRAA